MTTDQSHRSNEAAWISLLGNVVLWPGAGTLFLRRWLLGAAQCLVALVGLLTLASSFTWSASYGAMALVVALVWSVASSIDAFGSDEER